MARTHHIATIPGDGVGIEVTAEAVKAVDAAADRYGFSVEYTYYDLGGARYLRTGDVLPDTVYDELGRHDAILLGAVGTPGVPPGVLERGLLLRIRFGFDQYVNLRPVKLYEGVPTPISGLTPDRCDIVVVRENTEGPYAGSGGIFKQGTPNEVALQESINTRLGVERVVRYSFEPDTDPGGRSPSPTRPTCSISPGTCGGGPPRRWRPSSPTCHSTTSTSTPPACTWSTRPRGLT
jgi:3-isopropylmalate dehydrogenase